MRLRLLSSMLAFLLFPMMTFGGELRGRIESGRSPAGAWQVLVTGIEQTFVRTAIVDGEGRFTVTDLPAGRAGVTVIRADDPEGLPRGGRLVTIPVSGTVETDLRLRPESTAAPTFNFVLYRGEYYNNQPDEGSASTVLLPEQGTASNINFELTPGGGTISGRVTRDGTGAAVAGVIVTAFGESSDIFSFDRTDAGGFYRITGIPADTFLVAADIYLGTEDNDYIGELYDNTNNPASATLVGVAEGADTPNINFALAVGGSISGRVTADVGGAGIAFVSIYVRPVGGSSITFGVTDGTGHYRVRGLAAGNYTVEASPFDNFLSEFYNNQESSVTANPVAVTGGSETANIDLSLATGGRVTGTVTDAGSSQPLRDLLVIASRRSDNLTNTAFTGADGSYAVEGLPTGEYVVSVPEIGKWWNNRTNSDDADGVNVTAGTTTPNINFSGSTFGSECTLPPEEVGAISGLVSQTEGSGTAPVAGAEIHLYVDLGFFRFEISSTETDDTGHYTLGCLDANDYLVECVAPFSRLLPQWYDNTDSAGAAPVAVLANRTTTDINFLLSPGATISGHVGGAGGVTLPFAEVVAKETFSGQLASTLADAQGDYQIDGSVAGGLSAGSYKVYALSYTTANPAYVPVVMSRLTASADPEGIVLEWRTTADSDPAAFQVERAAAPDAPRVTLTDRPLTGGPDYRFVDRTAGAAETWWYWVVAINRSGRVERFGPVVASASPPVASRFLGAAPNPTRDAAVISFQLAAAGPVRVDLFDASGRLVRQLLDEARPAGLGSVRWDGRSDGGAEVGAGLYFVRWTAGATTRNGRIMLVR